MQRNKSILGNTEAGNMKGPIPCVSLFLFFLVLATSADPQPHKDDAASFQRAIAHYGSTWITKDQMWIYEDSTRSRYKRCDNAELLLFYTNGLFLLKKCTLFEGQEAGTLQISGVGCSEYLGYWIAESDSASIEARLIMLPMAVEPDSNSAITFVAHHSRVAGTDEVGTPEIIIDGESYIPIEKEKILRFSRFVDWFELADSLMGVRESVMNSTSGSE